MSAPARRKALFVTHAPRDLHTAVYRYYAMRASWLEERGHAVEIWVPSDFEDVANRSSRWWPIAYPRAVSRRLRVGTFQPDLVFFHSYAGWWYSRSPHRRRTGAPRVVTQFHGLEPIYYAAMRREMSLAGRPFRFRYRLLAGWLLPGLIRSATRRSDRVFCLNSDEVRFLVDRNWSEARTTSILPPSIEEATFVDRVHRPLATRLLFVGQWLEGKGTRYLVPAFEQLARAHPELRLHCAGVRCEPKSVLSCFGEATRARVEVAPELSPAGIVQALRGADIFVFPTLSEGFGIALLEAMAAGLPIVCTPVGAARDLLHHGESALLIPPGEVGPIVGAVSELLAARERREQLGSAARAIALGYRTEIRKPQFVELVEQICTKGAS